MKVILKISFNVDDEFIYKKTEDINEYLSQYVEEIVQIIPGTVCIKGEIQDGRI